MSPNFTPVYRLPFAESGEPITEVMERTRYMSIDRQLEALFTFLGDGIISGWSIKKDPEDSETVIITKGSGVILSVAVATNSDYKFQLSSDSTEDTKYYFYVESLYSTPHTAAGKIIKSTTLYDSDRYLLLGYASISASGNVTIDDSEDSGRKQLTLLRYLLESISEHVHTGEAGEPSKIDLFNHVKGVLSTANIEDIPASKINSGIIDKERFELSHKDLKDKGILNHNDIDGLIGKFQNVNSLLFGDMMTSNLIQLILSLKHVWSDVDEYFYNFSSVIPGIGNNSFGNNNTFIDVNNTTAEIDYLNHRIKGKYVESKEVGQHIINTIDEWSLDGIDGGLSYSPLYLSVSSLLDAYGYGYGYGYGIGLDYFDVFQEYDPSTGLFTGFTGDLTGYGTDDFESTFNGSYGYGYGYEHTDGFDNTLFSTEITLKKTTSFLYIYDQDKNDIYNYSGNSDIYYTPSDKTIASNFVPNQFRFLMQISDEASVYNKRSSNIKFNNEETTDIRPFISATLDEISRDSDQAVIYALWEDAVDLSENNYLSFILKQVNYKANDRESMKETVFDDDYLSYFDEYWSPDISMDLVIETTVIKGSLIYRHYFKYQNPDDINEFLLNVKNNNIFSDLHQAPSVGVPAEALIQANLSVNNLIEIKNSESSIGGYLVPTSEGINESDYNTYINSSVEISSSDILKNVTGIFLYTRNDINNENDNFNNNNQYLFSYSKDAGPIILPQGQRYTIGDKEYLETVSDLNMDRDYPIGNLDVGSKISREGESSTNIYRESRMLVDIGNIYVSGSDQYRYREDLNVVEDIVLTFPDTVDFNSISWVSTEPSNSIVYIQIKRISTGIGEEEDDHYNTDIIYTNKGDDLLFAQSNSNLRPEREAWLSNTTEMRSSGSDFPSEYQGIRSIALKAVLLPSAPDKLISPVLNSITINYTSNTSYGDINVKTQNDWSSGRSMSNIKPYNQNGSDYVTIEIPSGNNVIGKTKNLIYGTEGSVVEVGNIEGTWTDSVKTWKGDGLPQTISQKSYYNNDSGISGSVTALKKRTNGDIIFLEQCKTKSGNRIIILDKNYNIKKIITSDIAFSKSDNLTLSDKADLIDIYYNGELGNNGILYFVFSHELKAWYDIYNLEDSESIVDGSYFPDQDNGERLKTVDLSLFRLKYKGTSYYFNDRDDVRVIPCGRGVLGILLDAELGNLISSREAIDLTITFNGQIEESSGKYIASDAQNGSCVTFYTEEEDVLYVSTGTKKVTIKKPYYDIIYSPIDGCVSFDIDEDDILYILKDNRPYSLFRTQDYPQEPWYVSMDIDNYWSGWIESSSNFAAIKESILDISNVRPSIDWEPNFNLGNIYGERGCIQKYKSYLIITISNDVDSNGYKNGILIFKKNNSGQYSEPEEPYVIEDFDLYPMAARFDLSTYDETNDIYGDIYIALSDLSIANTGKDGKSKVIKIRDSVQDKIIWQWGSESLYNDNINNINEFAITVNDIFPLSYKKNGITLLDDNDVEIIVST